MWIIRLKSRTNEPALYFKYYGLENDIDSDEITTTASKKEAAKIYEWKEAIDMAKDMNGEAIRYYEED